MKILVYDDNPDFGGHQIMACRGIEALVETPGLDVTLMYNPDNRKLIQALEPLAGLRTLEADPRLFQSLEPDLALVIQGDIAQSTAGVLAARKAGIECVSYLAIPHPLALMGAKLGAVRDAKNRPYFNKPDRFITIADSMKMIMQERGCKKPVAVVPNGIPAPPIPKLTRHDDKFTIGLIGRIEFNHKQQDFFVEAFQNHPAMFAQSRVLIVGSGPDETKLIKQIKGNDRIVHLPWQDNMEEIYELLDMVIIPSRFEGVPLVMLEALARGIPVMGSRRDGMKDLLPQHWTFIPGDAASLAATFFELRNTWQQQIETLQDHILQEYSIGQFKARFVKAVTQPPSINVNER